MIPRWHFQKLLRNLKEAKNDNDFLVENADILHVLFRTFYAMQNKKIASKKEAVKFMRNFKLIPKFKNEDEERKFWATHDSTDYIDWSKAKKVKHKDKKIIKKRLKQKMCGLWERYFCGGL